MTESLNCHSEITFYQNGHENGIMESLSFEGSDESLAVAKPPRKKVSFHDNVIDIDEEPPLQQNGRDDPPDEEDKELNLEEILNVTEKINFFKTAFADGAQTKENGVAKSLGHQSSIPEARLAFVTGMVQSSLAGNNSRVDAPDVPLKVDQEKGKEDDTGAKQKPPELEHGADELNSSKVEEIEMATEVTFMKIFASTKTKLLIEAAVDSSSILEHREEIRELWEKRMMADENQSSPSSTMVEKGSSKTPPEEGNEETVAIINNDHESVTKADHKLTNGHVTKCEGGQEDSNANHIHEKPEMVIESQPEPQKEVETELTTRNKDVETEEKPHQNEKKPTETTPQIVVETTQLVDIDNENNNAPDSLEVNINTVVAEHVVETTYTSETSLVMKQVEAEEVITTKETIFVKEEAVAEAKVTAADAVDSTSTSVEEQAVDAAPAADNERASELVQVEQEVVISTSSSVEEKRQQEEETRVVEAFDKQIRSLEIDNNTTEDDDGYVRVAECLPHVEGAEEIEDPAEETEVFIHDEKPAMTNGHEPVGVVTPEPFEKPASPDIEQFVKSGGLKRILPGVQKTEQPYSTCTTETKIAMEIREMREREEELRIMREQAILSPVVSPVPPKSPRSDSPCLVPKEITTTASTNGSPVPPGCGYRVSSVFGHKGNTSPSPPVQFGGEEKVFKGFSKESTVEKEIRLARDREEELRAQKGLPPREDDSYVKPSQVKSSQVRVFGKPVGATSVKQAATAKIQLEIEEQTQREMALRETGSIQTLSSERTDAKVAKLKTPDTPPAVNGFLPPTTNGSLYSNGNGRSSPDVVPHKRGTPSPTGHRPASIFSQTNGTKSNGISMHKFIASKGKESTFSAPPKNGGAPREENGGTRVATVPPNMVKLKRTVSVESKIQQEIMEMKQREEELKMLQLTRSNSNMMNEDDITEHELNHKNNKMEYENGIHDEELSPRHNKLIAQWEQRIQKAES